MRLLPDVSTRLCPVHWSLLVGNTFSLFPSPPLHCLSTFSVVVIALFFHNVMLLLATVHFPSLKHARPKSTFVVPLFCQQESFLVVGCFSLQSHFSTCHILLLSSSTVSLTGSFLLWKFFAYLLFLNINIPNHITFHITQEQPRVAVGPGTRDIIVAADILRKSRHVDPSLGLIYTHPAREGSRVCPVTVAATNFAVWLKVNCY